MPSSSSFSRPNIPIVRLVSRYRHSLAQNGDSPSPLHDPGIGQQRQVFSLVAVREPHLRQGFYAEPGLPTFLPEIVDESRDLLHRRPVEAFSAVAVCGLDHRLQFFGQRGVVRLVVPLPGLDASVVCRVASSRSLHHILNPTREEEVVLSRAAFSPWRPPDHRLKEDHPLVSPDCRFCLTCMNRPLPRVIDFGHGTRDDPLICSTTSCSWPAWRRETNPLCLAGTNSTSSEMIFSRRTSSGRSHHSMKKNHRGVARRP